MVLDSQIRRAGGGRRNMASRRQRGRRWPWVAAVAGGMTLLTWLAWPGGGAETEESVADAGDTSPPAEAEPAPDTQSRADAEQTDRSADTRAAQAPDAGQAGGPAEPDDAPAFTLGAPVTDASDSELVGSSSRDETDRATDPEADRAAQAPQSAQASASQRRESVGSDDTSPRSRSAQAGSTTAVNDLDSGAEADADDDDPVHRARAAARGADGDLQRGMDLIAERDFIEGRRVLSRLLYSDRLGRTDAQSVRDTLESVNRELVFSSEVISGDPIVEYYTVQSGDTLGAIARQYQVPHQFVMQINGIERARDLQAGQRIKLIKGPFHARVYKREFRMDLTVTSPDGEPIYITSFPVGLGENDSTPPGEWIVAPGRKVVNPSWRNPRTGEFFSNDDPENPIGNYWIALDGADEDTRDLSGYGLHGTIEPESIGAEESMGCIRLLDDDIEQTFYMLQEGQSRVSVYP